MVSFRKRNNGRVGTRPAAKPEMKTYVKFNAVAMAYWYNF
jgi:hypothetical protein